ncbi:GntR family transcriptional regulator [Paenibacillus sp.]|uniref:GntR family transcriptional regulator n=1 Tax=Paenibacillus sp. TaxID=58172 RepID=UPI002D5AB00A|nr:GntR family transcriptional regulator [Paenibacillus sp.]HZG58619.1 GntR family transcriptional regulator [Paenibacillus sp.]
MNEFTTSKPTLLLKEQAYRDIREAILNETFRPGEFLSEKRLIDRLGMSKTPIKAALERLESEGFVQVSPKQGIVVKEISVDKVRDLFELRTALELFVCESIAGRLRKDQIAELEANLAEQRRAADDEDEAAFTRADAAYHILLSRFSGNQEIHQIMIMNQAHLYRSALRVIKRVPNRMRTSYEDHESIAEALVRGETERAKSLMREHLVFGQSISTT